MKQNWKIKQNDKSYVRRRIYRTFRKKTPCVEKSWLKIEFYINRVIACRMMFVTLFADRFSMNEKLLDPIKAKASFVWAEKSVL